MVIMHNMLALYTGRQLGINEKKVKINMEKLSSGYKINRAADDASGLAISEKMRRQIRGLNQGTENLQDGVSWVQIGDGAMEEVQDILHRMTELAVKGANGTLSVSDRETIDSEIQQLKIEINRINETTKFNDMRIFSTDIEPPEDIVEFTIKSLTGEPDDLNIFNATYDDSTGRVTYGGVVFHGNRVAWDKIAPNMVYADGDVQKFHGGIWSYTDDQGRKLVFSAKEGDTVPRITRMFDIAADAEGIRIDGELIEWKNIINEAGETVEETDYVNGIWTAKYHGMTIDFEIANAFDGFSGMVEAINNGHDDKYRYKAYAHYTGNRPVQAVDADIDIYDIKISEDIAKRIVAGEKYFLGADEMGLWLEVYNPTTDEREKIMGSKRSWAQMGIVSWNDGDDIKEEYNYVYSDDDGMNDTHISFSYTLANITSRDSVIDGLHDVEISYDNVRSNYDTQLKLKHVNTNIVKVDLKDNNVVALEDELALGRDFEDRYYEVGISSLDYDSAASSAVSLSYADDAGNIVVTFEGQDTEMKQKMADNLSAYEDMVIKREIMTKFLGYDLGPKDLKDYLGADKITTSGKMSEIMEIDDETVTSDGNRHVSLMGGGPNVFNPSIGNTYRCGKIDFSDINSERKIWELTGSGFTVAPRESSILDYYTFIFSLDVQEDDEVDGIRFRIDPAAYGVRSQHVIEISVSSLIEKGIANSADPGKELAKALVKVASKGKDRPEECLDYAMDNAWIQYAAKDGVFYALNFTGYFSTKDSVFLTTPLLDLPEKYALDLTSTQNGSQTITYYYDHSDYENRISVSMEQDNVSGKYVYNAATGLYEDASLHPLTTDKYNIKVSYADVGGNVDFSKTGTKTFTVEGQTVTVNTVGDIDRSAYVADAVKSMINATQVRLAAADYTKADRFGDENPNVAIDSFYSAFFAEVPYQEAVKIPESIRIQKSGDVPNYLTIPKFALNTSALGLRNANCKTSDSSRNTIDRVSYALRSVSSKRSTFGALQNRMEHAIKSNENVSENTTAAESRIRDTDMEKEMISFSNNQIVLQSIQAMLAQANQSSQAVLGLLG